MLASHSENGIHISDQNENLSINKGDLIKKLRSEREPLGFNHNESFNHQTNWSLMMNHAVFTIKNCDFRFNYSTIKK